MDERFEELKAKIQELDNLISDTLDNEPEEDAGTYGTTIKELFENTEWLDCCILK